MASDRNLTDKQQAFLDALFDVNIKGDIRAAMTVAGYSQTTPEHTVIHALADEIVEASKRLIAGQAAKVTFKALGILDDPTELGSDRVLATAKELWDRAGIVKKDKLEIDTNGPAAIFILPKKNDD